MTVTGTTVGTVAYMSPEQARGDEVDARTDVWSLGVVLYEMATGALPFGRDSDRAVLNAIVHDEPRPAKELRPGFPAEIGQVIRKALAKDPAKRYASAREMAADLRGLRESMSARSFPTAKRLSFRHRPRPVWIAAGALSLAAVAVCRLASQPARVGLREPRQAHGGRRREPHRRPSLRSGPTDGHRGRPTTVALCGHLRQASDQ